MKLLLCGTCQDVIRLIQKPRTCECGSTSGHYTDDLNAVYSGVTAFPIGFANHSLIAALSSQPQEGMGELFTAFVIPKKCPTFVKENGLEPAEEFAKSDTELLQEAVSNVQTIPSSYIL